VTPRKRKRVDFSWNKWSEAKFEYYDEKLLADTKKVKELQRFWRLLALCHTVMAEEKEGNKLRCTL
jgi:hypothetical protein